MFFFKKSSPVIKEWGNLSTTWTGRENVPPLNELVFSTCLALLCDLLHDLQIQNQVFAALSLQNRSLTKMQY